MTKTQRTAWALMALAFGCDGSVSYVLAQLAVVTETGIKQLPSGQWTKEQARAFEYLQDALLNKEDDDD